MTQRQAEATRKSMPTPLPDFENPPVIEVVCGVSFAPLTDLKAVHLGLLWERFRDRYPEGDAVGLGRGCGAGAGVGRADLGEVFPHQLD